MLLFGMRLASSLFGNRDAVLTNGLACSCFACASLMPLFGICGAILTFESLFGPSQYAIYWPLCAYAVVWRSASFMLLFGILGDIMTASSLWVMVNMLLCCMRVAYAVVSHLWRCSNPHIVFWPWSV